MNEFVWLLKIFTLLLTGSYCLLILIYFIAWQRIKQYFCSDAAPSVFVSIIVAARNEEKNIQQCLQHLSKQNYLAHLFEIIIANDFSDDTTPHVVESFINSNKQIQIKLINLAEFVTKEQSSKKTAITQAVKKAKGELIITTDADCTMNNNWIKTIADYYQKHQPYMISAPVAFTDKNSFDKIQSLEFMSLIGTGAAAIRAGFPLMCNAANLAFKKEIYFEVGRDSVKGEPFSGDDTFLMFAIQKKYPGKIAFLKSTDAIVTTQPQPTLGEFFNQRRRWTSKVKSYSAHYVQWIGIILFLFNLSILCTGMAVLVNSSFLNIFLMQIISKFLIDFIFLYSVTGFFKRKNLLSIFPIVEIIHVFYIIIISLLTFSGSYEWKNRKIKS